MSLSKRREMTVRVALYGLILSILSLYAGQFIIFKIRFLALNANLVDVNQKSEICDAVNCTATFDLRPTGKYLLLGHVMRYHSLFRASDHSQVFPVSAVRGVANESWTGLRVYPVVAGEVYKLEATKPKAVQMDYFIGVMPRSSDHEGVLSIPDISPTVSTISSLLGVVVLVALMFFSYLAPIAGGNASKRRDRLVLVSVSSFGALVVSAISTGLVDSLMPDGELRSRILRTAAVIAVSLIPISELLKSKVRSLRAVVILALVIDVAIINLNWQYFRAGTIWIYSYAVLVVAMSAYLAKRNYKIPAIVTAFALVDFLRMLGILSGLDSPPIYLFQTALVASFSLIAADLGAVEVIALAAKAYQRFTRDIGLNQLAAELGSGQNGGDLSDAVRAALPRISQITGAGRVSILINLPFARPITHAFDLAENRFVTHDDGKIPGAVTVRAFVYGDEAWFERYDSFSSRLGIPTSPHLTHASYVCIAPIRVNQMNMGVLMLTCFDDEYITRTTKSGTIDDDRETGRMVVDTIAARFSDVVIHSMKSSSSLASDLLNKIREAIPSSGSTQEFLDKFCQVIFETIGMRTMLHEQVGEIGVARAQHGFSMDEWHNFEVAPFNLSPTAQRSFGSTVVAFKEQKSSYIKDWHEIQEKLHPRTVGLLNAIDVRTFFAVPLSSGGTRFVVTTVSRRGEAPKDPGLMKIIESAEAIFDAAVTVFNQRTSVLALGKLANRLIGDDDVREKIIEAAKQEHLQTTIGTARTSFLLLFDLAGSSLLPSDTEEKARSYGFFYDEVNKSSQTHLQGKVRKTIGDAIIVTWDGTNSNLAMHEQILESLRKVVAHADDVARRVGCKGVRAVLHHGDYFFGLIGTASFGQIDVIGRGIDEVCKMEGAMKTQLIEDRKLKVAISNAAADRLQQVSPRSYSANEFREIDPEEARIRRGNEIRWALLAVDEESAADLAPSLAAS